VPDASDSILSSVKKVLGIAEDYTIFDLDIILHINSALATLTQLGIGPEDGFMIEDSSTTWDQFLVDSGNRIKLNNVKTYICLRVRLWFDPPQTSFMNEAFERQLSELEWRINVTRESTDWVDPDPTPDRVC
jgi:hypothetical protein